jgi:sugar lactone lactonase YvrE
MVSISWLAPGLAGAQTVSRADGTATISTAAGNGMLGFSGDFGPADKASLNTPTGVTVDLTGALYISDTVNNRIRKVASSTTGIITTFAGNGTYGFGGDGGPGRSAMLAAPTGVAADSFGDVFIADTGNNRIREVTAGGTIKTYAGNGTCSPTGDGGPAMAAGLCLPMGLAVDRAGDLFIADTGNNLIREVTTAGVITTVAGMPGFTGIGDGGDGRQATKAQLAFPTSVAMDVLKNLYIADTANNKIRVVNPAGIIRTFAGTGGFGYGGDGLSAVDAKLAGPSGLAVDGSRNVYISDTGNSRVRVVEANGIITTFAGTGAAGYSGDGGRATAAMIAFPTGGLGSDGTRVYFADTGNSRVRAVTSGPPPVVAETPYVLLLPVTALLIGGGWLLMARRRGQKRSTPTPAL